MIIGKVELILNEQMLQEMVQEWVVKHIPNGDKLIVRRVAHPWSLEDGTPGVKIVLEGLKQFVTGTP